MIFYFDGFNTSKVFNLEVRSEVVRRPSRVFIEHIQKISFSVKHESLYMYNGSHFTEILLKIAGAAPSRGINPGAKTHGKEGDLPRHPWSKYECFLISSS